MLYKAKASAPEEPNTLALFLGGLAERSNAAALRAVNGADIAVQGFESLTRLQYYAPTKALTSTGARTAQPKPYRSLNLSIRLLAVELNRRFHSDLPFMPNRCRESR